MMKIPDEFMASDRGGHPQTVQQQPQQNHLRRGSLDNPKPVFKVWNVVHDELIRGKKSILAGLFTSMTKINIF